MYHGAVQVYLIGFSADDADLVRSLSLPPTMQVEVMCDDVLTPKALAADAIFIQENHANDVRAIASLIEQKPAETSLVVSAPHDAISELAPLFAHIDDIWVSPFAPGELAYRFSKWIADRKRRFDAWESTQFLETTINSIPCLVWYKTKDGVHEKVNDSFCATVNKEKDDVQGRRHAYIWNVEQDDPACIASENTVMETKRTLVSEETVQTGDGTRLLTTYKSPLYDVDGTVMGTVGVAIDITQERAYEEDLVQKNQTLESIFTSLDCGIITHSCDGTRLYGINQAALSILGYATEEEMLADGFDMVAPTVVDEDKQKLREKFASLVRPGDSVGTEYRVLHKDGKLIHVLGNVKLIEKDGELLYQRFLLDNSDQKRKEQERERRQQNLLRALSEDYQVVCVFNLDSGKGETVRLSDPVSTELGDIFTEKLVLDRTFSRYAGQHVLADDVELFETSMTSEQLRRQLAESKRHDILYRKRTGEGSEFYQATIVRAGDWNEESTVVIGLRNVDRQTREELESKQLLEEALIRANRASEAKSTFLSNMSHDIRTPMNAIIGFAALANNHIDESERVREYLEKINASSAHLLSLINDILDMSRIESGKISLDEQVSDLPEIIAGLRTILQPGLDEKHLSFTVDAQNITDTHIVCDKLKLEQVLLNLLGNSVKFTEDGGRIELSASEERLSDERALYHFAVRDNGIGMTKEFLSHIFDPFERERTSTLSGIQGTGLGMAITKNLVTMMGGTIEVESEKGVGTEFSIAIEFSIVDDAGEQERVNASDAPEQNRPRAALRGCNILLVDDNLLNREIGVTLLQDAGFSVDVATNGQEAIDVLTNCDPATYQLVLMDIQMPVMNGYEAASIIRSLPDPHIAHIPVLAVTADAFDEDRQKALDCGMNGHIAKPIEIDQLFATLDTLLLPDE